MTDRVRRNSPYLPFVFAFGMLAIGMGVAGIGYAIGDVPDAGIRRPPLYPADWLFWAIWVVLYPAMGLAAYHLWRDRTSPGGVLAWRLYLVSIAANLTWVPVVHLFRSPVAGPAVMDAVAGVASLPALWAITRSNRRAFLALLPVLVWGPITGSLKVWQLLLNRPGFPVATWRLLEPAIYAVAVAVAFQIYFLVRGFVQRDPRQGYEPVNTVT